MFNSWRVTENMIDPSGAMRGIDVTHSKVHVGHLFHVSYKTPDASPIADNTSLVVLLATGARYCHIVFGGSLGGEAEAALYEGATVSNNGTVLSIHNMNRATGVMTPSATAYHTPTVSAYGIRLYNAMLPGGTGAQTRVGGSLRSGSEWILKANTSYLAIMTNRSGTAQQASIAAEWYEVEA